MSAVSIQQKKKIHPHKFTLWIAIGSILMMFAGLTSAYIVKRAQANWALLEIPTAFWISTAVILTSSVTVYLANKAFHDRQMIKYRNLLGITAILGIIFLVLQIIGFASFSGMDIKLVGAGSNASFSFLLAIAGLHGVHVLGGIIALIVIYVRARRSGIIVRYLLRWPPLTGILWTCYGSTFLCFSA
jgi:cytochrome c oxidase subunit III